MSEPQNKEGRLDKNGPHPYELSCCFSFESARFLPKLPEGHPCRRVHGNTFKAWVFLGGSLDSKMGWLVDYHLIRTEVSQVLAELDHRLLNEVPGLENPTTENICRWLFEKVEVLLPQLSCIKISENDFATCTYRPLASTCEL